jgi:hypothetical protein
MLVQLEHDGALDIPAGDLTSGSDDFRMPLDVEVLPSILMRTTWKLLEGFAMLPDGTRKVIRIPDWDPRVRRTLTTASRFLPKGSVVSMRYQAIIRRRTGSQQSMKRVVGIKRRTKWGT